MRLPWTGIEERIEDLTAAIIEDRKGRPSEVSVGEALFLAMILGVMIGWMASETIGVRQRLEKLANYELLPPPPRLTGRVYRGPPTEYNDVRVWQ